MTATYVFVRLAFLLHVVARVRPVLFFTWSDDAVGSHSSDFS